MTGRECAHKAYRVVCHYYDPRLAREERLAKVVWCWGCGALAVVPADTHPTNDDWTPPRDARSTLTDLRRPT